MIGKECIDDCYIYISISFLLYVLYPTRLFVYMQFSLTQSEYQWFPLSVRDKFPVFKYENFKKCLCLVELLFVVSISLKSLETI